MSSVSAHYNQIPLTGGTLIGVGTGASYYTTFAAPATATLGAGSRYSFPYSLGASAATTAVNGAFTTGTTLAAGTLMRDMGDRLTFLLGGEVLSVWAKVQLLNDASAEGTPTNYYVCIHSTGTTPVAVARL